MLGAGEYGPALVQLPSPTARCRSSRDIISSSTHTTSALGDRTVDEGARWASSRGACPDSTLRGTCWATRSTLSIGSGELIRASFERISVVPLSDSPSLSHKAIEHVGFQPSTSLMEPGLLPLSPCFIAFVNVGFSLNASVRRDVSQ